MQLNKGQSPRISRQDRRPPNRGPGFSPYRLTARNPTFSLLRGTANLSEVFRPLPRDVVRAFLDQPTPTPPRFVILLPVEAPALWEAINLAVILGQSLRHMPELRSRDELVLDVQAGTYHHVFCDLLSPGGIECFRPNGHDGPCAPL